jgi:hypothetical protein
MMSSESLRSYLNARAFAATAIGRSEKAEAAPKKEMAFELAFVRAGGPLVAGADPTGTVGLYLASPANAGSNLSAKRGSSPHRQYVSPARMAHGILDSSIAEEPSNPASMPTSSSAAIQSDALTTWKMWRSSSRTVSLPILSG